MSCVRSRSFLIAARALNGVIGNRGALPWVAPHDLAHFKDLTMGTTMIMGRSTWDSLPSALPGRTSIVVTSRPLDHPKAIKASSFEAAIEIALNVPWEVKALAFIGGTRIYQAALELDWLTRAHITTVHVSPDGDTLFPSLGTEWTLENSIQSEAGLEPVCDFTTYTRPRRIS